MPIQIDTTTPRLSNFEAGVIAEMTRLLCREVELVEHIQKLDQQIAERDATIAAFKDGLMPRPPAVPADTQGR